VESLLVHLIIHCLNPFVYQKMDHHGTKKIYFISGHFDGLSDEIFALHYKPLIDLGIKEKSQFIVGDAAGADTMAQCYLHEMAIKIEGQTKGQSEGQTKGQSEGQTKGQSEGQSEGKIESNFLPEGLRERVTVFHMFDKPRNNIGNFATHGGFKDDESRDRAMTIVSTDDILWIRPVEESKKLYGKKYRPNRISGTEKNKLRREEMAKKS
jgi:hypothetical protein